MAFYFVRADENAVYGATVTTTAGATDSTYLPAWMCDGRSMRPVRSTNGTVTWSASFASAEVGIVALCDCDANVNATIGGGVSATVVAGALGSNGIRLNGFALVTPATISTLTVGFSGASSAVRLGECIAGKARTITAPIFSSDIAPDDYALDTGAEFHSVPPYDRGMESRKFTGSQIYSTADRDLIWEWWRSQRANTRPSLMVPDSTINDAWLGYLQKPSYRQVGPGKWEVQIVFIEEPRSRW